MLGNALEAIILLTLICTRTDRLLGLVIAAACCLMYLLMLNDGQSLLLLPLTIV